MPEPPSTPVLHRRVVRAAMALALMGVTAVGFVLPLGHLVADPHALRGDRLVYLMVCFAFAAVVTNTSMSLAFGATTTEFVPDEQPVLLASMVGGPVVGGLVGFASLFDVGHVRSVSHPWKLVPAVGVNAAAATAAGWSPA